VVSPGRPSERFRAILPRRFNMSSRIGKQRRAERLDMLRRYREAGQPSPFTMEEVARWALASGFYPDAAAITVKQLARELASAARSETLTDPTTGLTVRSYHSVRGTLSQFRGQKKGGQQ
jgi:hypothetical protein